MIEKLVSIIIPAYNQAQFLNYAIDSVIAQTYKDWECIIVDDGSTDHTASVAKQYSHPAIRYLYQNNRGLSAARNSGMAAAQGEYLSFLDADDGFLPNKLELLLSKFNQDTSLALAVGQSILIDQFGQVIDNKLKSSCINEPHQLLMENPLNVGSVLLRSNWQEKIGWFDTKLRSYEDWDYWLRLVIEGGKIASILEPVSYYRFHSNQMTRDGNQMTKANFDVLNNVFDNPHLPADWQQYKDLAYSHAHLRAAANAYLIEDISCAREHLQAASSLNPGLLADGGKLFIQKTYGWTDIPKTNDPLRFLATIFNNLPKELETKINYKKNAILGNFAIQKAFHYFQTKQYNLAGKYVRLGVQYDRTWLQNRGVLRIMLKTWFNK
ncbi:MAG: hypothetical protein BGO78_13580 [Chloroflexi bacterium 44-23]|nr:MAG: hypothetical protein BGO78_13580 [Chloroflexi bacterium 44-23]